MNFDFYKPYLKPMFGWPTIVEVDKLLSDIFEYNQYINAYIKWYNNDHEEKATEEDLSQEIHGVAP